MKLHRVEQQVVRAPLADRSQAVREALDRAELKFQPGARIAITAGSRGIDHIDELIRAAGDWLKHRGAEPFIVPAMGSHNGATAEGQQAMIESLGITEEAMKMPIRSSMDVVRIGEVETGPVLMDRHCFESDGVLVLNRLKLHTCFSGPIQSGLTKMMVVGMGKIKSAETFHSASSHSMAKMLGEMGTCILESGKILGGLAVLEDGFDETAEIHAMRAEDIPEMEPRLLERHQTYFPRLPVDDISVLIVDRIGKTFSGTGMDTNVIGTRGVKYGEDLESPRIQLIAALRLDPASQGNAIGVGLADFITRELRESMDEQKTFINVVTTGDMARMKIPATLDSDEALFEAIETRFGSQRWMIIPNTLHLETLYVTEDLAQELQTHPRCTVDSEPIEVHFTDGRHGLEF